MKTTARVTTQRGEPLSYSLTITSENDRHTHMIHHALRDKDAAIRLAEQILRVAPYLPVVES